MPFKLFAYIVVSAAAIPLAAAAAYAYYILQFRSAWWYALILLFFLEIRVQFGGRLSRGMLFWIHLTSAIAFFIGLSLLAFIAMPAPLIYGVAVVFIIALYTGSILWYRGVKMVIQSFAK